MEQIPFTICWLDQHMTRHYVVVEASSSKEARFKFLESDRSIMQRPNNIVYVVPGEIK